MRGLNREMTQLEVVRAVRQELGKTISQAYLSQIENGARRHLTDDTRMLLARFFKVHPGYLVSDPEGFQVELVSAVRTREDSLDLWLVNGAERFEGDPELRQALLALAEYKDTRKCLLLVGAMLKVPDLIDRLGGVLNSPPAEAANRPVRKIRK